MTGSAAALERQVAVWNAANPIGAAVIVCRDLGQEERTTTRSAAYVLSGHSAVIFLDGIAGCYALERVRAA